VDTQWKDCGGKSTKFKNLLDSVTQISVLGRVVEALVCMAEAFVAGVATNGNSVA
jgi:hypothetical protein